MIAQAPATQEERALLRARATQAWLTFTKNEKNLVRFGIFHAVIARIYEYSDSELVYTPNGADSWPPKKRTRRK